MYKQNSNRIDEVYNIINVSEKNSMGVEKKSPFSDMGFVLPDSSKSYLTANDLSSLNSRTEQTEYSYSLLLRYAVNEIYARHGYLFHDQKLYTFYSQYKWYNDLPKKEEVPWIEMNEYEQSNLTLLLNEEKQ